ncbi:hypothetical protein FPL11_10015 [Spiribacter aquaticus]|uniref:Uncharacterized protein n=1 Tax=Spiribacter aquaticus TaxID=1935996 RepID=A0A557RDD2_9GAMM|nr:MULTISPECIES: hypothetical protein [Spiribacter]TVO63166.1 hypothetical protein FPL11_10015 [Spiribacter aquaticus]
MQPDIFLPVTKKLHFFNDYSSRQKELGKYNKLAVAWYERFFRDHQNEVMVGEVTPMYINAPSAIPRIAHTLGSMQLIVFS